MGKYIKNYLSKYKIYVGIYILLAIVGLIFSIYKPLVSGNFIDSIVSGKNKEETYVWAKVLIIISVFVIFINYISSIFTLKFQTKLAFHVNLDMIKHMQKVPLLVLKKYDGAYLNTRINSDSNEIINFLLNNMTTVFSQMTVIISMLCLVYKINKIIFYVELAFIPIYILLYIVMRHPIFKKSLEYKEEQNHYFNRVNEQFRLIGQIKTEATFDKSEQTLSKSFSNLLGKAISYTRIATIFSSLDNVIGVIFQVATILISINQIYDGKMTIGQFTILNSYFALLIDGVKYYLQLGKSYQSFKVSIKRMQELDIIPEEANGTQFINNINRISINNINFHYDKKEKTLLDDFSYSFTKGFYVIKGNNGTGKTTMLNILIGLIQDNVTGEILYNGMNIKNIDLYKLRRKKIGIIIQNIEYPNETIKTILQDNAEDLDKNLLKKIIDDNKLWNIYSKNNFDIINSIHKNCLELSGGEKQKVELIKVLIKKPDILIMDEPTSAMDNISVNELIKTINTLKEDKIVIIITHDERIISIAENIISF